MKKYLALFAILYGCTAVAAERPEHILVEFWQDADSARFVVSWTAAPVRFPQVPTDYYDVQLVLDALAAEFLVGDTTSALNDTLALAYPPIGSSITFFARVRNVDIDGDVSEWLVSTPFTFTTRKLPPSPPGSITVDTVVTVVAIFLRPSIVNVLEDGGVVQFCSFYLLSNGQTGHATNNTGIARCDELYARWLTERSA